MAAELGDSETYDRPRTCGLVPFSPQSVLESPKVTIRTAGEAPDMVLAQARLEPGEVAEAPRALARTW